MEALRKWYYEERSRVWKAAEEDFKELLSEQTPKIFTQYVNNPPSNPVEAKEKQMTILREILTNNKGVAHDSTI